MPLYISNFNLHTSALARAFTLTAALIILFDSHALAHQADSSPAPVVVQPGAPGKPSKTLPASTHGSLPPLSRSDVEFMQGMIMHHAQAVEMTALIPSHTNNQELRELGARISSSQSDEIRFMKRWLAARGEPLSLPMTGMEGMDMSGQSDRETGDKSPDASRQAQSDQHPTVATPDLDKSGQPMMAPMALMPGMLTPEQMEALRKARGAEFDYLFLTGMIQHHEGALTMVKELFDSAGAGQDADIFNFATDADNTQRAEIRIMQSMLKKISSEEKR
jgi:uncharacterized protein (DUF305 family)